MAAGLHVVSDLDALRTRVTIELITAGVRVSAEADHKLLLDRPWGWALQRLPGQGPSRTLVFSDNPCPEYQLDLAEQKPLALLHDLKPRNIAAWLAGREPLEASRKAWSSPLTVGERAVLQLTARGLGTDEVAERLETGAADVEDCLDGLCRKLCLVGRVQAALYYLGSWHMLESWQRPPHVASRR